jgi:hypothetical protein
MSELLEKKSGGKHKIKVFNKQALGSEKETIDQVKIGALDLTRVNVGPMNAICPLTQVPTMPFLFGSIAHMRKVLDGPVGDEILKSCESGRLHRPGLLRQRCAQHLRQEADQDRGRRQGPEDPRAAERPVGGPGRCDGRQRRRRCPTARSTPA